MVYTVTLNPALDYVVRMGEFRPGETNRTDSGQVRFGGKGINVSVVLRNLGVDNVALGFLAGFTGRELDRELRAGGVKTDFIWLEEGLTRINVKIQEGGRETEINGQGPRVPAPALERLLAKLDVLGEGDVLVLAGSIPKSLPDSIYQRILRRLEGRGVLTAVDAARDLLWAALPCRPFLVKPNRRELGEIFGRTLGSGGEIEDCARRLQAQGARNVLVSMAEAGSLLVDETGRSHRLGVPRGTARGSVGAGDSMVAGFLAGWLREGDYAAAHRMGAAAGAATAFSGGLAQREQVLALMNAF